MFGDNKSVVDSASIPTSTLSKKSTLASYHRVREAIAAGYLQFNWKDGKSNPAIPNSRNFYSHDGDITCTLPARSYPTRFYQRAHPTHIYVSHAIQILKNPPEHTMRNRVQSGRNTKNDTHAHLLGIA